VAAALREEVYFGYNNVRVPSPDRTLARAVRWMTARGDAQIVIEGHADPAGTPDANRWLAQKRAESVRDYLVSVGIDASRIEVVSYGDTRLKYGSDDGRNRRAAILSK
jgi:peptidoglycan-associated lipoprotein